MRPSIGIPTTAGTGREAQSYALITCGGRKVRFHIAVLDPNVLTSVPQRVRADSPIARSPQAIYPPWPKKRLVNGPAPSTRFPCKKRTFCGFIRRRSDGGKNER